MAKETVIIGCKLPAGLKLEIGYKITPSGMQVKAPDYQTVTLKGWNEHTAESRRQGIQLPSAGGDLLRPYLNRGVPRAFWERWAKEHPDSWLLKNQVLFVAEDEASAALLVKEGSATPAPLAPLNKDKPLPGITQADFTKKTTEDA
jgi:hypothetical protein